jgi:PhnB protein
MTPGNPVVQPYLFFNGRCEEAIEFYKKAVGAEVMFLMRFKDSPEPPPPGAQPPGVENKIMHSTLRIGGSVVLVSDGRNSGILNFDGFAMSLSAPTPADADRWFAALSDGGKVVMHICKTFFSPRFGMVTDKFGVVWMVIVQPDRP